MHKDLPYAATKTQSVPKSLLLCQPVATNNVVADWVSAYIYIILAPLPMARMILVTSDSCPRVLDVTCKMMSVWPGCMSRADIKKWHSAPNIVGAKVRSAEHLAPSTGCRRGLKVPANSQAQQPFNIARTSFLDQSAACQRSLLCVNQT